MIDRGQKAVAEWNVICIMGPKPRRGFQSFQRYTNVIRYGHSLGSCFYTSGPGRLVMKEGMGGAVTSPHVPLPLALAFSKQQIMTCPGPWV